MRNENLIGARLKIMTVFVMVIALAAGCSRSPVDSSIEPTVLSKTLSSLDGPQLARGGKGGGSGSGGNYVEAIISGKSGGELELGDVALSIPRGAMGNDTLYSISIPDLSKLYFDFGTDGLVFMKPVKVTMSYSDADLSAIDESTIRLGWYDKSNGTWVDMECTVDFRKKTVTGYLDHFSAYGVISD